MSRPAWNEGNYNDGLWNSEGLVTATIAVAAVWLGTITIESPEGSAVANNLQGTKLVTITFTDADGVAVVPTTVELHIRKPTGPVVLTGSDLTNTATGVYTAEVDVDDPGPWLFQGIATGEARTVTPPVLVKAQPIIGD